MRMRQSTLRAVALLLVVAAACSRGESHVAAEPWAPAELTEVRGVPIAEIRAALAARLQESAPAGIDAEQWRHARRLYDAYDGSPLWLSQGGLHEARTAALMDAVLAASDDGLSVADYPLERLGSALAAVKERRDPSAAQLAEVDVLLSATYAAVGEDLLTGQVSPRSVSQNWHVDPQDEDVDTALMAGLRISGLDRSLAAMRPQDPDYDALRRELRRYREIVTLGGWAPVPATGALKPGDPIRPEVAAALRNRLAVEGIPVVATGGDTAARRSAAGTVYDEALAGGVAQFQARHTIVVDSVLGQETLDAMNRSAAYRLAQIAANLERYRWLPRELGSRYIFVNVPAFRLEAHDAGRKALEMRVIVGAEYQDRATPVFADSMSFVVFRPYWYVPDNIAESEILPRGSAYLAANNFETYTSQGQTRLRQRPGENNSLGLIKFMFPNDFAIYLHDTPNSELFDRDIRAFSHGCIRVEHPDALGSWVLGWPADSVRGQMEAGRNDRTVNLERKIPVYITYVTTFVRDGILHFGNDLYARDEALVQAVAGGAMPDEAALRTIQALRRIAER